jgi:hypothetical protein
VDAVPNHLRWHRLGHLWLARPERHSRPGFARRRATLAQRPDLAKKFGPYILTKHATLPIGEPIGPRPDLPVIEAADRNWEPAPDGRYCIDATTTQMHACVAITYAFWCIQAQPLATSVPTAPPSSTIPAWSCCAAPARSPNPPTANPNGTTAFTELVKPAQTCHIAAAKEIGRAHCVSWMACWKRVAVRRR